jgi:membrane protein required for colicin V production
MIETFASLSLNWFDYIIIGLISLCSLLSLLVGFVRAFLFIITWAGAFTASYFIPPILYGVMSPYLSESPYFLYGITGVIFVIVLIVFFIMGYYAKAYIKDHKWGFFDKSVGLLFGLLVGALLSVILFLSVDKAAQVLNLDKHSQAMYWYRNAETHNALQLASTIMLSHVPGDYASLIENGVDGIKKSSLALLNLDSSGKANSVLSEEDSKTMREVMMVLPEDKVKDSFNQFQGGERLTPQENRKLLKHILESYKRSLVKGDIGVDSAVEGQRIKQLEVNLSGTDAIDYDAGYRKKNLNELDQLIETVE